MVRSVWSAPRLEASAWWHGLSGKSILHEVELCPEATLLLQSQERLITGEEAAPFLETSFDASQERSRVFCELHLSNKIIHQCCKDARFLVTPLDDGKTGS